MYVLDMASWHSCDILPNYSYDWFPLLDYFILFVQLFDSAWNRWVTNGRACFLKVNLSLFVCFLHFYPPVTRKRRCTIF